MISLIRITRDGDLFRQLEAWRDAFTKIQAPFLTRGVQVEAKLVAGQNTISHGLRAPLRGWIVLRLKASSAVSLAEASSTETTLVLVASGPATVTLWVY